jgi:hypothetical protein
VEALVAVRRWVLPLLLDLPASPTGLLGLVNSAVTSHS